MDHSVLRRSNANEIARYFRANISHLGTKAITDEVLSGIEAETLPPSVFGIWLTSSGECHAVIAGLKQPFSQAVRTTSILQFGKLFRSARIKEIWHAAGELAGVLEYLSQASVRNVKQFCREIGKTSTSRISVETRQGYVDELFHALRRRRLPSTVIKSLDRRPLAKHQRAVFPAASPALAAAFGDEPVESPDHVFKQPALESHVQFFRQRMLSDLSDEYATIDIDRLLSLLDINSNDNTTFRGQKFPANLVFGINALQLLAVRQNLPTFSPAQFHNRLSNPLFRKLNINKCKPDLVTDVIDAYIQCYERHIHSGMERINAVHPMTELGYATRRWSRYPDELSPALSRMIQLIPQEHFPSLWVIGEVLDFIPWTLRYNFLALFVRNVRAYQTGSSPTDLASDDDLKSLRFTWSPDFLQKLPKPDARPLLERLVKVKSNLFDIKEVTTMDDVNYDPEYLLLTFAQNDSDVLELAIAAVEERKKEATKARRQPERCFWVRFALRCAAISGSLDLYRETLTWAKRYTKDPLTAAEVYRKGAINETECINLLCGFTSESSSRDEVEADVLKAHVICRELFDTAFNAVTEPSFKCNHWSGVLRVLGDIVQRRLERVGQLQDALSLSDDDVFQMIWEPTIDICIELEQKGLLDENEDLGFNRVGGPMIDPSWTGKKETLADPRPASLRFLDTFALSRDDLWQAYRRSQRPATLALPHIFPRGLPLDCLVPYDLFFCKDAQNLPYLHARAEEVVFLSSDTGLAKWPEEEQIIQTMGPLFENWREAFLVFIYTSRNRQDAALRVWKHAVTNLSRARMSATEAFAFWRRIFSNCLLGVNVRGPWTEEPAQPPPPRLPVPDSNEDQPVEWNPEPDIKSYEIKQRELTTTVLDGMIHKRLHYTDTLRSTSSFWRTSAVPVHGIKLFWERFPSETTSLETKEALITAVLLYIGAWNKQSPGLLSRPFPSSNDVRIPAVFLDGDFMDREDLRTSHKKVWSILERLASIIPPMLLLHLIKGVIEAAKTEDGRIPVDAIRLLKILTKSDKPQLALDLVRMMILEHPEDSSWQRALLTEGLFRSLPRDVAREFMMSINEGVRDKLGEQSKRKINTAAPQAPLMKVTTVKMLSQLMSGADFIDDASACHSLISILSTAGHIDVLVSVIESLLQTLLTTFDSSIRETILDAFEKYAVPIMASTNERQPLREQDWRRLERDASEMPDIYMEKDPEDLPPVTRCMLEATGRMNEGLREQLFARIFLPVLRGSIESNKRWLAAFVRHLGYSPQKLPDFPLKLQYLTQLLRYPEFLPSSFADLLLHIFAASLNPPSFIQDITEKVKEDAKLRLSAPGKHWLSLFSDSAIVTVTKAVRPSSLLTGNWTAKIDDGLQIPYLQKIVLEQADLIINNLSSAETQWVVLTRDLSPASSVGQAERSQKWYNNALPVVEELIGRISRLRTDAWQCDPHRTPPVLPDTFLMRIWLLYRPRSFDRGADIQRLGQGILDMLQELGQTPRLGTMEQYRQVKDFIDNCNLFKDERVALALLLAKGTGQDKPSGQTVDLVEELRADLARQIIIGVHPGTSDVLRTRVHGLVRTWLASSDERIRNMAMKMVREAPTVRWDGIKAWYANFDVTPPGDVRMDTS